MGGSDVFYTPSQGGGPNESLKWQEEKKKSQWASMSIPLFITKGHQKGVLPAFDDKLKTQVLSL